MPKLTMIAGPNGSGKSTITAFGALGPNPKVIDPDAIAKAMNPVDPAQSALAAGREAILLPRQYLETRESFAVETTLAGNGQLALLAEAKTAGFEVQVVYIALARADMQIARVKERFVQGGHTVPEEDILRRYQRSLANAPKALRIADSGIVFDNSGTAPELMLRVERGRITWEYKGFTSAWVQDLKAALTQSPSPPAGT